MFLEGRGISGYDGANLLKAESGVMTGAERIGARVGGFGVRQFAWIVLCAVAGLLGYFVTRFAGMRVEDPAYSAWVIGPLGVVGIIALLTLVGWLGQVLERTRRTGRFGQSQEERTLGLARMVERLGSGKPFGPQAYFWLVVSSVVTVPVCLAVAAVAVALGLERTHEVAQILLFLVAAGCGFLALTVLRRVVRRGLGRGLPTGEECAVLVARYWKPGLVERNWLMVLSALGWTEASILAVSRHNGETTVALAGSVAGMYWLAALLAIGRVIWPKPQERLAGLDR